MLRLTIGYTGFKKTCVFTCVIILSLLVVCNGIKYQCTLSCVILIVTWLVTHNKVIHNCEESQARDKSTCYWQLARLIYSVFNKRLKEVKHEIIEVIDCGKLFQTAGAAWQNALSPNACWPDLAVGSCSCGIEGGMEGYETGSIQT